MNAQRTVATGSFTLFNTVCLAFLVFLLLNYFQKGVHDCDRTCSCVTVEHLGLGSRVSGLQSVVLLLCIAKHSCAFTWQHKDWRSCFTRMVSGIVIAFETVITVKVAIRR